MLSQRLKTVTYRATLCCWWQFYVYYYWPAEWAGIVLLAGVRHRRRLSGSVTLHGGPGGQAMTSCRLHSNYSSTVTLHGGPVRLRLVKATLCYELRTYVVCVIYFTIFLLWYMLAWCASCNVSTSVIYMSILYHILCRTLLCYSREYSTAFLYTKFYICLRHFGGVQFWPPLSDDGENQLKPIRIMCRKVTSVCAPPIAF